MRWINDATAAEVAAVRLLEDLPGNPSRTETRVRGRLSRAPRGRITPRFASIRHPDGSIDIGLPDDGWSASTILSRLPLLGARIVDERRPVEDPSP